MFDHLLVPQAPAHPDGLVQPAAARMEVESGRLPLAFQPTRPDADQRPAPGNDVEGLDGPGRYEPIVAGDYVRAKLNAIDTA